MNFGFLKFSAFSLSPEREHRLLDFAKDQNTATDDGSVERPAWLHVDSSEGTAVDALIAKSRAEVEGVRELPGILQSPTALLTILDSQAFAAYRQRIEFRMHRQEPEIYGPITSRTHLSGRTILEYLITHPSDAEPVYEVINELSKDPQVLLTITQDLQHRKDRYLEQERILTTYYGTNKALDIDKYNLLEHRIQTALGTGLQACVTDWVKGIAPYLQITDAKLKPTQGNIKRELKNVFSRQIARDPQAEYDQKPVTDPDHHRAFAWLSNLAKKGFDLIKSPEEQAELQASQLESSLRGERRSSRMGFTSRLVDPDLDEAKASEVDFKEETLSDLQGHLGVLKNLLLKRLEEQASEVRDEICKEMEQLGIVTEFANEAKEGRAGVAHRLEQKYGISYQGFDEAFTDTIRTIDQILDPKKQSQILPSAESPHFVTAIAVLQRDLSYKQRLYKDKTGVFARELEGARLNQAEIVDWAKSLNDGRLKKALADLSSGASTDAIAMVASLLGEEPVDFNPKNLQKILNQLQALALGNISGEGLDEVYLHYKSPRQRAQTEQLINVLASPTYAAKLQKQHEYRIEDNYPENTDRYRQEVHSRLVKAQQKLGGSPALQLTICKLLDVPAKLRRSYLEVQNLLKRAAARDKSPAGLRALNQAKNIVKLLEATAQQINTIQIVRLNQAQFEKRTGHAEALAFYSHDKGEILLNVDAINNSSEDINELIEHEMGHAVLHTLSEGGVIKNGQTSGGLFEGLISETGQRLEGKIEIPTRSGHMGQVEFIDLLRSQGKKWGVASALPILLNRAKGDQATANQQYDQLLLNELLNKYADWVRQDAAERYRDKDPEQIALFDHIHNKVTPTALREELDLPAGPNRQEVGRELGLFTTGSGPGATSTPTTPTPTTDEEAAEYPPDTNKRIRDMQIDIDKLEVFFTSYPRQSGELKERHKEYQAALNDIRRALIKGDSSEQQVHSALDIVNETLSKTVEIVNDLLIKFQDLSDAPNTGREGWRGLFDYVDFYSINDIWGMIKDSAEDINRYWKRRVDYKKASLGENLTGWISDKLPYAGRLKHEFHKRGKTAEIEEVNQWKEGLKDDDSFSLLDSMKDIRNADQLKAIFELLTERGRMDWNNEGMWDALNALSIYTMPKAACKRDDVLRDKWLRKLIAEIWGDKDKYNEWRQANDSNYESGKEKFSAIADQVSNISGGLASSLKQQLEMFVLARESKQPIPEEVNPQLYEKILFYSIENGKMTMEQKFFYLIQGIRYRLISRDRLAVIAGEGGKILQIFPFIDYFYGKNNSMKEIEALGKRLEEGSKTEKRRFKPGKVTTMFLRLEVAREEAVKERLRKGVSKVGESIDHDDIPYFLPELDYSGVDEWFANMSGSRQKLSKEALKNGYVGYSMKLKSFAALATMEDQQLANFSGADVQDLGQTIGAYIFADNILTRNGYDNPERRPYLSKSEIDNQRPVYGADGQMTGRYRNQLNGFVQAVLKEFVTQEDWDAINQEIGASGNDRVTAKNFAGQEVGTNASKDQLRKNVYSAIGPFVQRLTGKLVANQTKFKNLLKKYGNELKAPEVYKNHNNEYFIEDAVAKFSSQEIADMYRQRGERGSVLQ